MQPRLQPSTGRFLPRVAGGVLVLLLLVVSATARAAEGEVISTLVPYKTYTLTPGKLTGKEFYLETEKLRCREFSFEQFRTFPKPKETVELRLSLRGGYRAHDLFGHDDFEPKEAEAVATGWVPLASGNFLIFPDQSKKHLPKWIPERTRLIRVPLIKQYGDTVVNAYDLALGLDRFNKGEVKPIDFTLSPAKDDNGREGVRLTPVSPLSDGVYYAYSLPDDKDTANYGFLFVVGNPELDPVNGQSGAGTSKGYATMDAEMARLVMDYALLSQAIYDLGTDKYKAPNSWEAVGLPGLVCLLNPKRAAFQDLVNGFKASTFVNGKKLAVVFQGTNPNELVDWTTDFFTLKGVKTGQYQEALDYASRIIAQAGTDYDIVMTGHSLGGGLATYAALYYDKPAIVFNAAPIGSEMLSDIQNVNERKLRVKNIDMKGDVVSGFGGQSGPIYVLEIPANIRAGLVAEWKAVKEGLPFIRDFVALGVSYDTVKVLHSMENIITALQILIK